MVVMEIWLNGTLGLYLIYITTANTNEKQRRRSEFIGSNLLLSITYKTAENIF